jgi:hypothetical protein
VNSLIINIVFGVCFVSCVPRPISWEKQALVGREAGLNYGFNLIKFEWFYRRFYVGSVWAGCRIDGFRVRVIG